MESSRIEHKAERERKRDFKLSKHSHQREREREREERGERRDMSMRSSLLHTLPPLRTCTPTAALIFISFLSLCS